ncbi:MAG: J domain-containing protein [Dehalococcoidia bacterium]
MDAQSATMQASGPEGWSKDFYQVLRLQSGADAAAVEQAYWYLARRYNAALRHDPEAKEALDELNEAYGVLGSPVLRREYDFRRTGIAQPECDDPQPKAMLSSIMTIAADRAKWRQGTEASTETSAPALPSIDLPDLQTLPWRKIVAAFVVVVLGVIALIEGAHTGLVLALMVLGLVFAGMPLPSDDAELPVDLKATRVPRQIARPENLGEVLIPRGTARGVRKLVYQVYEQCPHLGPADVRAVTRYAFLSQRFLECERQLSRLEEAEQADEALRTAAEQRALAAELRLHEAALGMSSISRSPHRASSAPAIVEPSEEAREEQPATPAPTDR